MENDKGKGTILKLEKKNGPAYYTSDLFSEAGIPHGFFTRHGGVSTGDFGSLNVSTKRTDASGNTDAYENTLENFRRILGVFGVDCDEAACAHQVHGKTVIRLEKRHGGMGILKGRTGEEGDALFIPHAEGTLRAAAVKSADCTPVLLADRRTGDVCALHAGWRGTCLDIVGEAVGTFLRNGSRAEDILCAVGPSIGVCCYEVTQDVREAALGVLSKHGDRERITEVFSAPYERDGKVRYTFGVGKLNAILAVLAGIPEENVDFSGLCTCCTRINNDYPFFSHRRQHAHSGTQCSVIVKP